MSPSPLFLLLQLVIRYAIPFPFVFFLSAGSFDGQIHRAAIHSSDRRATGADRVQQHMRAGGDQDQCVGVPPGRRGGEAQELAGIGRVRPVAEESRPVVPGAAHFGMQGDLGQQWEGFMEAVLQSASPCCKGSSQTLAAVFTGKK